MKRLASSHHVIIEYGSCGQSTITDFVDGNMNTLVKYKHLSSMDILKLSILNYLNSFKQIIFSYCMVDHCSQLGTKGRHSQ